MTIEYQRDNDQSPRGTGQGFSAIVVLIVLAGGALMYFGAVGAFASLLDFLRLR